MLSFKWTTFKVVVPVIVFCVLFSLRSHASHVMGADLSYKWLSGLRYEITLTVYRDCASPLPLSPIQNVYFYSISCNAQQDSIAMNLVGPISGTDISPICQTARSRCRGGTAPGIEKYVFKGTTELSQTCTDWLFYFRECNRSSGIRTVQTPSLECLYVQATLNNVAAPGNSSPRFSNNPDFYLCVNKDININAALSDTNNDRLVYQLVTPRTNLRFPSGPDNNVLRYLSGYSAQSPIRTSAGFNLDSLSGTITFRPTEITQTVTALLVKEYRNGQLIGTIMRDFQIITRDCPANIIPEFVGFQGADPFSATLCTGIQNTINFRASDGNASDSVYVSFLSNFPGATFGTSPGRGAGVATLRWTPTLADTGTRFINLVARDNACPLFGTTTGTYKLRIVPSPTVRLRNDTSVLCGVTIPLNALVSGGVPPYSFSWSGVTGSGPSVTVGNGNYSVTVTDQNGCRSNDGVNIRGSSIVGDFTFDSLCLGQETRFTSSFTGQPGVVLSYLWTLFGNQTSTLQNPTFTYPRDSVYTVILRVTGTDNCTTLVSKQVTICTTPQVTITVPSSVCEGLPVPVVCNSASTGECAVSRWTFRLNQNNPVTNTNGRITYQSSTLVSLPDTNNIRIVGATASGCAVVKEFKVLVRPKPVIGDMRSPIFHRCDRVDTVLNYKVWMPAQLASEAYRITVISLDTNFTTDFLNADTTRFQINVTQPQTILVTAVSNNGCEAANSVSVLFPLTGSVSANAFCRRGDSTRIRFNGSSRWGIDTYQWDMGNGQTSTNATTATQYPEGQFFNISVRVADSSGCLRIDTLRYDTRLPDTVAFSTPDTICFGGKVGVVYPLPQLISRFTWRAGTDSVSFNTAGPRDSLTVRSAGNQVITVRINYKGSCVRRLPVGRVFVWRQMQITSDLDNVCAYDSTQMTGAVSVGDNPISSWNWTYRYQPFTTVFATDNVQNPTRLFNRNGNMRTQLVATDTRGCRATSSFERQMVLVSDPAFDIIGQCQKDTLTFIYGRVPDIYENIRRFSYDFGDGNTAANENGLGFHSFNSPGSYLVVLTAFSREGCFNQDTATLVIKPRPTAVFDLPPNQCQFTSLALDGSRSLPSSPGDRITGYTWFRNEDSIQTGTMAGISLENPETFNVSLRVSSDNGCKDSLTKTITVFPAPRAGFFADENELFTDDKLTFEDRSTGANRWVWDFDDGNTKTIETGTNGTTVHRFVGGKDFNVSQVVSNAFGCADTAIQKFQLRAYIALPTAFSPNNDGVNDALELKYRLIKSIDEYKIFNRFGQVVFEGGPKVDENLNWDGKLNGIDQPVGTYLYLMKATTVFGDPLTIKGNLQIVR